MKEMNEQFANEVFEACAPQLEAAMQEDEADALARFTAAILPVVQRHGRPDADAAKLARRFMGCVADTIIKASPALAIAAALGGVPLVVGAGCAVIAVPRRKPQNPEEAPPSMN